MTLKPAPQFIVGGGLLLWGWQNGFLIYALPMAVLLELATWATWRWPVSDKEFNNVADLSGVVFFLLVIYIFAEKGTQGIFTVLAVTPFVLYPLILIQQYSERGRVKLSALIISLRLLDEHDSPELNTSIDLTLPYFLICVVSASAGNQRTILFFILVSVLLAMILWSLRPRRYHTGLWASLLFLSFILAYGGQEGIKQLQLSVEGMIMGMFDQFMWSYRDPDRTSTSIGTLGRLKLSDRIVLRVKAKNRLSSPLLLREASYGNYGFGVWGNASSEFNTIDPDPLNGSWSLSDAKSRESLTISAYLPENTGVIPLPYGTTRIYDTSAFEINLSRYGTVKMETRKGWVRYKAAYNDVINDPAPDADDLYIADNYKDDFYTLARNLKLDKKSPATAVRMLEDYFSKNFFYSLTQRDRFPRGKYLHNFLFKSRKGHCEFFATATVLLLRAAGIPARYVVGYSVSEYSPLEGSYIVRARHAHSWAMAYFGKTWHVIDTTPSIWAPMESENASFMEPVMDFFAWARYRYLLWQAGDKTEEENPSHEYLLYLLIPLVVLLVWNLYFKKRIARTGKEMPPVTTRFYSGKDSELYTLVKKLEKTGHPRMKGETLLSWFRRIKLSGDMPDIDKILRLHYQYRFDPDDRGNETKREISRLIKSIMTSGKISPGEAV